MLLREVKSVFHRELDAIYGTEEVRSFLYLLIEHHLGLQRFVLAMTPDITLEEHDRMLFFEALDRLRRREPIQYILGSTYFMEMRFDVNEHVLIPRPETEELVRWILDERHSLETRARILDVGTGSGCIAIALAKHWPHAEVHAVDISEHALQTAKANAAAHEVAISFFKADVFTLELEGNFDIIVSNPPYVRESEKIEMEAHVLDHEPGQALFVSDENPLQFYKAISSYAAGHLKPSGRLYFEINQYLGQETQQLLQDHNFSEIELRKDLFGNDRLLKGTLTQ